MRSSRVTTNTNARLSIQTSRLVLREARSTDLHDLHVLFSQDETMKYWSSLPHTTIAQSKTWLDRMIASPHNGLKDFVIELRTFPPTPPPPEPDPTSYPISDRVAKLTSVPIPTISDPYPPSMPSSSLNTPSDFPTPGKSVVVGKIGCWNDSEIGFILNKTYWGKGYASEALEAALEHLFSVPSTGSNPGDHNVSSHNLTLKADVDPRNKRCLRLLEKFGFVVCGREEKTFETHLGWCDSVYLDLTRERWVACKRTAGRQEI